MTEILNSEDYFARMMQADCPVQNKIYAFYEHRVGAICKDPRLMLLPLDDHIVHRGDGVFETFKYMDRKFYQLDQHMERMERSCNAIHLAPPCSWDRVREIIFDVARAADQDMGMMRLLIGRGPGGFAISPFECPVPSMYVVAYKLSPKSEEVFEKGATAAKSSIPAKQSYMAKIKSTDYLPNMLITREAIINGYDYGLCFNEHGFLAEGSIENVCLVDQNGVLNVPEFTNALTGTTLMRAISLLKGEVEVRFRHISEPEIYDARELIIVGTTIDALSIVRYNGKPIHDVRPGPVSKRMRELLIQDQKDNSVGF